MTTELLPVGVTCNLRCSYCYETNERNETPSTRYNREVMLKAVEDGKDMPSLFGGEPLLMNLADLEELFAAIHKKWGKTQIQTNGSLITEAHIDLFRKYKTFVGISVDGPDELNDSRWIANIEATRKRTAVSMWAIKRLCEEQMAPGLILTLHAGNASKDRFPKLVKWFHELDAMGVKSVNIHIMELDAKADTLYLPQDELADRLIDLWNEQETMVGLRFSKFTEILNLLVGETKGTMCHWHACDPMNTESVQSIDYDGSPTICRRGFKDGKRWLPGEGTGQVNTSTKFGTHFHARQIALSLTPEEHGGCKDCPFWLVCQAQCPGEAENGDWREKTHYCGTMKRLFTEGARRLRAVGRKPLPDWQIRKELEKMMFDGWVAGQSIQFGDAVRRHQELQKKQKKCSHG